MGLILIISLIAAADDSFNINVTCSFIDIDILDIYGDPYPGWMPDTLEMDEVYYTQPTEGMELLNSGNIPIQISMRAYDSSDDTLSGYRPWSPALAPLEMDEFSLAVMDTSAIWLDSLSTSWIDLDTTYSTILTLLEEGEGQYIFIRLHTPPLTSDRRAHDLCIEIEGSIP